MGDRQAGINVFAGIPPLTHAPTTGRVFFVGNSSTYVPGGIAGVDHTSYGDTPYRPFATIDYAIGQCTASRGDVIYVLPGHSETITAAGGIDADVIGIKIIGLGEGRNRPTVIVDAATTVLVDIDIDAASITIENLIFDCTPTDLVTAAIDVNAADFTLKNCDLIQADSTGQATRLIVGATAADRMKIVGNTIRSTTAGAASAINLVGTADGVEIANNYIYGDFSVAAIENATGAGNVHTNLSIHDNYIQNDNNGNWAIELVAASTGEISDNRVVTDAIATAIDWGGCAAFRNLYWDDGSTDANGTEIPTAQTTGGMDLVTIGERLGTESDTDPISEVLSGTGGITTWKTGAAPATGVSISEALRYFGEQLINGTGTALPTNDSLYGVLAGASGITTFPNAALPANNVSIAEVLREAYDQSDKSVTNTTAVLATGTTLFTIAGGPIEILSLVARCVVGGDATAATLQWSADPTDGAAATFSGASSSIANSAAGAMVILQGTALTTAPTLATTSVGLSMSGATPTLGIIVGAGIITSTVGSGPTTTGTWQHHLRYRPLSRGVTVTGT